MPLLRRQPFIKEPIPDDLEPDEELFHCKLTNEVFRDYDAFFERVILCNSLVWTCKLTGKPGLTYLEAANCEEKARETLSVLPTCLKLPILFLARSIRRHRLGDLCHDVFGYMRERFFIGEDVDAVVNGERRSCRIVRVLAPNGAAKHSLLNGNGNAHDSSEDSDAADTSMSVILPSRYKYHVRDLEVKGPAHLVIPSEIVRKKSVFTKDRAKLFLKHACELKNGHWLMKDSIIKKYNIDELKFGDMFAGPKPNLDINRRVSSSSSKGKKEERRSSSKKHKKKRKSSSKDSERHSVHKEVSGEPTRKERRQQQEEERRKRKEEKEKEREKQREERRIMAECLREWQKPRDDLECDDLMDLPNAVPIATTIPNDLFGDVLAVVEFLHDFTDLLSVGDHFASGMTLETMEKALMERDVQGPLNDLLQMLLVGVFNAQEDENEDEAKIVVSKDDLDYKAASFAANTPMNMHGVSLRNITLDPFTLSEVLRLHFLSSGVRLGSSYTMNRDDPGIRFRIDGKDLLRRLCYCSVFDMSPAEKLQILMTLISQLLACKEFREDVEDNIERLRMARNEVKQFQWAEQRREREDAALRLKLKTEEETAKGEGNDESEKNDGSKVASSKSKETFDGEAELDKQEAKRKLEGAKKEKELTELVNKLQNRGVVQPLGRDRAFRRFWMFNSVPGLFVEDDDDTVGPCLSQPTPYNPNSNPYTSFNLSVNEARHRASGGACDVISDKENAALERAVVQSLNSSSLHKSHKLLSDNHPTLNGIALDSAKPSPRKSRSGTLEDTKSTTVFGMCNSLGDVCPAHGKAYPRMKWAFFPTVADVEALIASLNPRGFREGSLKEVLVAEKKRVLQSVSKCPVARLNPEVAVVVPNASVVHKSSRLQTSGPAARSSDTVCEDILNVTLRDSLAEMEEKIYAGGLGSLKVTNRVEWRDRLLGFIQDDDETESIKTRSSHLKTEEMGRHSSKLAKCLLEIYNGIEPKYLTSPLNGDSDATAKKTKSLTCQWRESLAACTSLSQVFVHLATLEKSVAWSRSVLNARCRICRRKNNAEHMLLCDECDRGHHIYCLKPQLKEIPEGDWLCKDCSPKPKPVPKKQRIRFKEDDDDDAEEEEEEEEEDDDEEDAEDEENEDEDDDEEEEEEGDNDEEMEVDVVEPVQKTTRSAASNKKEIANKDRTGKGGNKETLCVVCNKSSGLLVCCNHCSKSCHLACVRPSQRKAVSSRGGKWACSDCTKKSSTSSAKTNGAVKRSLTETDRPRRLERKAKCVTNYSKLSKGDCEDDESEEESASKRPRRSSRRTDDDVVDEEWCGIVRRQMPPSRRGASEDVPLDYRTCDQLLTDLVRHEDGWPFLRPVTRKEVADYYDLIKKPVDFGTIRSRLNRMDYRDNKLFVVDVMLVFQNCCVFNPAESMEYRAAERLGRFFLRRIRETGLVLLYEEAREDCGVLLNNGNDHLMSSDDEEESIYVTCTDDSSGKETESVPVSDLGYETNVNDNEMSDMAVIVGSA